MEIQRAKMPEEEERCWAVGEERFIIWREGISSVKPNSDRFTLIQRFV